ncbi:MAG: putative membrane protein [Parcubacteria bacterium C7867-003]|nr:MAG: putative membrane protein [Parcubacteria bacterium C7867-003]
MKKGSTLFLKAVLVFMALAVLAFCIFAVPTMGPGVNAEFPGIMYPAYIVTILMYASAIPFFCALYNAFKLLIYIDRSIAFSEVSIKALRNIKYSAVAMTVVYFGAMPLFFQIAEIDDAPGMVPIGTLFICAPLVIAVFAAVLEKLVKNAIEIKTENDLTV